jgi:hypothetical protein
MEFAELKGTEKQVNWAKAIRKDRLKVWQGTDPDSFQGVELSLTQQGMASWWITSRDKSLKEVCSQLHYRVVPNQRPQQRRLLPAPLKCPSWQG